MSAISRRQNASSGPKEAWRLELAIIRCGYNTGKKKTHSRHTRAKPAQQRPRHPMRTAGMRFSPRRHSPLCNKKQRPFSKTRRARKHDAPAIHRQRYAVRSRQSPNAKYKRRKEGTGIHPVPLFYQAKNGTTKRPWIAPPQIAYKTAYPSEPSTGILEAQFFPQLPQEHPFSLFAVPQTHRTNQITAARIMAAVTIDSIMAYPSDKFAQ